MARKKRRGVTLFELLRKDHGQPPGTAVSPQASVTQQQQVAPAEPEAPATAVLTAEATPEPAGLQATPKLPAVQVDEEGYILHLSRQQMLFIGAGAVVVLLVVLLIGGRMFRSEKALSAEQAATQKSDGEQIAPLASLAPLAGSENVTPDSPVRLLRSEAEVPVSSGTAEPEQDVSAEPARPMAAAHVTTDQASIAGQATGDPRKPGLNYLVIQIIPADAKPSAQEHAAEVRKFLASKGIRTIMVAAAGGGIKIISEQGFDSAEPADKDKCEKLTEKVRQAGKEYASAKYTGRYNFASPYREKYKK